MFIVMVRTIILYFIVLVIFRVMGKRQVGELQPFELAITIMVSALGAIPMEDTSIPLLNSIIPIFLLLALQVYISAITTKSRRARAMICGTPTILIENGKINRQELIKNRINIDELMEELRLKGYPRINEIEFAFIETNGQISVIPKSQYRPATPNDLKISTEYEGLNYTLIVEGELYQNNLQDIGISHQWLEHELAKFGAQKISDVYFASIDTNGKLFYQLYSEDAKSGGA